MSLREDLKKFWNFLWYGKSIYSYIAFFVFAIIVMNVGYPLTLSITSRVIGVNDVVAVVSGSMVHDAGTELTHYAYLQELGLGIEEIKSFPYNNGLNPGDLLLVWNREPSEIRIGDIIVFQEDNVLIIHRVIQISMEGDDYYFTTKGDHNYGSMPSEINITSSLVKGVAENRIPLLGIPKMILTNFVMAVQNVL